MSKMRHPFNDEELTIIFEAARVALADADVFQDVSTQLCLEDEVMQELQEKINKYMGVSEPLKKNYGKNQ